MSPIQTDALTARNDVAPGHAGPAAAPAPSASLAEPVDERNPFWPKYLAATESVLRRAREPFEITEGVDPSPGVVRLAIRFAIRLALQEHQEADAGSREALAAAVQAATMEKFWAGNEPVCSVEVMDAALRFAVLSALSASGIEQRWRDAAEWQRAWEQTEAPKGATPARVKWLFRIETVAIGAAIGALLGIVAASIYYDLLAR